MAYRLIKLCVRAGRNDEHFLPFDGQKYSSSLLHISRPLQIYRKKFTLTLQTDAYSGYACVCKSGDCVSLGCMAHARRKFTDVLKAQEKHANANYAVREIKKLYEIEDQIRQQKEKDIEDGRPIDYEAIRLKREKESKPILVSLKAWMDELQPKAPPKGLFGKALAYSINNWAKLTRYLEAGYLEIDNNLAENAIRPFALGRKNWLFCGNHDGARASALIYSLIESAKMNHLKPFEYLKYVLTHIQHAHTEEELLRLLPNYVKLNLTLDMHYRAAHSA